MLLAGPEGAQKLLPRPVGWLRNEADVGRIGARIHQDENDPGQHGTEKVRRAFGFSYTLTGSQPQTVNSKLYTEPSIVPAGQKVLSWLRENAFASKGTGWFSVGYGAFRRLTRSTQIIVPSLEPQARFTNFTTQFDESEPLSVFERWMVYLDYRIAKDNGAKNKSDRFPETDQGGPIVNPCEDDPEAHFRFLFDPATKLASVCGKTRRGATTEELLGLNRAELREYRSRRVCCLLALAHYADSDPEAAHLLQQAKESGAEYAAFARVLFK